MKLMVFVVPAIVFVSGLVGANLLPSKVGACDIPNGVVRSFVLRFGVMDCGLDNEKGEVEAVRKGLETELVDIENEFIVPVFHNDDVVEFVVLSLSIEVLEGKAQNVYELDPKIRDSFLRVMFDFSHLGGFNGDFVHSEGINALKAVLMERARLVLGEVVQDVFFTGLVKQKV